MIAKISYGSSLYGVLAYNQLKVDERHADVLVTSRIAYPKPFSHSRKRSKHKMAGFLSKI